MAEDQKNFVLAIVLSIVIIVAFEFFYMQPLRDQAAQQAAQQAEMTAEAPVAETADGPAPPGGAVAPAPPGEVAAPVDATTMSREQALEASPRIEVRTPRLSGTISLTGGRIDDLTLIDYRETVEPDSPRITLLYPQGGPGAYFVEFGWVTADRKFPGRNAEWRADYSVLSPGQPVTLTWEDGNGLVFTRRIEVDEGYMFTVTQRVENRGQTSAELAPYGLISRTGTPPTLGFYILHEGLLGVFGGTLKEIDYDDEDLVYDPTSRDINGMPDKLGENLNSTGGWLGISDKYWLVALVPEQSAPFEGSYKHLLPDGRGRGADRYQVDFKRAAQRVPPGGNIEVTDRVFIGAKEVNLINRYVDEIGIERFDLAIDWGWYPFLTKPIFYAIDQFNRWFGNFGVAILLLTVLIKAAFFPLANKSYKAMSKMKKLQPQMVEMREKYGEDKQKMQQELMKLYKEEKVNPAAGCLPVLIQIPVFFALYKVLFVTIEMRHAPFFGWIRDLSAPDPTSLFALFGLIPFDPLAVVFNLIGFGSPEFLAIGVWPLAMGLTMFLQQKLNPQPADPMQAKIMMMLPIMFTFILARFPAGLVIYWTWNNVLSIAQQWIIMRRMGVPA
ncbi:MAG: membrane protein insertase YidC [Proteobacteria bacterium]|nr:membrane protein insertase YidC [Pseudomonadota bacterium]